MADKASVVMNGGRLVSVLTPQLDQLFIDEIAFNLAGICRFNGATPEHYSVAQHSVLVAQCLMGTSYRGPHYAGDVQLWAAGLMHDAAEGLIGDMMWPVKKFTAAGAPFCAIEDNLMAAIRERFGIRHDDETEAAVDLADRRVLLAETRDFFGNPDWAHERVGGEGIEPWPSFSIVPQDRQTAYQSFRALASWLGVEFCV